VSRRFSAEGTVSDRRGLLLATLFAAQVGGSTGHSIGMAVGGIMAATITGTWINLPWFAPFIYAFSLKLGEAVLSGNFTLLWSFGELTAAAHALLQVSAREHAGNFVQMLWDAMFAASKPELTPDWSPHRRYSFFSKARVTDP